ncbi:MAG: DUF1570 domain-containing protein [Planctomycetes bacterium]|nr:DUF1570 domain-containing protein [Planctomycetota bacterium]
MLGVLDISKRAAAALIVSALLVCVPLPAGRAVAADDPKTPPAPPPKAPAAPAVPAAPAEPFQVEIEMIRRLAAEGKWRPAKDAIEGFFKLHANDPKVCARLPEIEEDLRRCLYRLSTMGRSPVRLLGRGCTKYDTMSRTAEFGSGDLATAPGWTTTKDGLAYFDVQFEGSMTIEYATPDHLRVTPIVAIEPERRGSYAILPIPEVPSLYSRGDRLEVVRLDSTGGVAKLGMMIPTGDPDDRYRLSLLPSKIKFEVVGRSDAVWCSDTTYRKGYVAFRSLGDGGPGRGPPNVRDVTLKGVVPKTWAKRTMAESDARLYREWAAQSYDRETALPAWVIQAESDAASWQTRVPFDCPVDLQDDLRQVARDFFEAEVDVAPAVERLTHLARGATKAWVECFLAATKGDLPGVERAARQLATDDPGFAPAHTMLGLSLLARNDVAGARAALDESRSRDPGYAPTYDLLVDAAIRDGDFPGARAILAQAAAAGAATKRTAELRHVLLRVQRGPAWAKRFESQSTHFSVASDVSQDVCTEVARVLEDALSIYAMKFRPLAKKGKARVYVFSGEDGYLEYAADMGSNREGSLGVYVPKLRELCIFLHENREELWATVRHEAFHQYLHNFIESAPIWFNEGYAEYFSSSRRVNGIARAGQVSETHEVLAGILLPEFKPLRELFLMDGPTFMANADVHYVQSWAVIHYLRDPTEPELKKTLSDYTDALIAGKSREVAFKTHMEPVLGMIERGVRVHVEVLSKR